MKKCRRCSKPATSHIMNSAKVRFHALHLCETCAQEYLNSPDFVETPDDQDALAAKLSEATGVESLEELDHLVCPNCGITFCEFRSQGRLGCPHDYTSFEEELMPLLENIHGETQHTGKFPKRAPDASRRQYELIKLRSRLRTAVEEEAYEEAAQLRDEIQELEVKINPEESEAD